MIYYKDKNKSAYEYEKLEVRNEYGILDTKNSFYTREDASYSDISSDSETESESETETETEKCQTTPVKP